MRAVRNCPISVPIYCEILPGSTPHVFVVLDTADLSDRPIVQVIATTTGPEEAFAELTAPEQAFSAFWTAVRATMPAILYDSAVDTAEHMPRCHIVQVDFLRAAQFGWRPRQVDGPLIIQTPIMPRYAEPLAHASTQTLSPHWPAGVTPLPSGALPALAQPLGCRPVSSLCPEGPISHLVCSDFGITCEIPCLPDYHIWALRIGAWIYGACTASLQWNYILEVAESSVWDLPGTAIVGVSQAWEWPNDISSFSGQCGHLVHSGEDPYLCFAPPSSPLGNIMTNHTTTPAAPPDHVSAVLSSRLGGTTLASIVVVLGILGPFAGGVGSSLLPHALLFMAFAMIPTRAASLDSSSDSESPAVQIVQNDTRTCTVAWCHELACQTTHFGTTVSALAQYMSVIAPDPLIRLYLWRPFRGPTAIQIATQAATQELSDRLLAAGHLEGHALHVAFDTMSTSLDLLSVPRDSSAWWIVRDGLGRELLRPVSIGGLTLRGRWLLQLTRMDKLIP